MSRRCLSIFVVMLGVLESCQPTSLYESPRFVSKIDKDGMIKSSGFPYTPFFLKELSSFAIVPVSTLTDSPSDSLERRILFSLYRALVRRTYRFSQKGDSADFIVSVKLTNDVQ